MRGHGTKAFRRLRPLLAAAAMGLLAGCAVYPDEVSDGYGGGYRGGGFYDYPGHYYSYYPGYYAYCPPVHVPHHYWSHWRKHRHWPDGWNHGHGGHDHAAHDRPRRDRDMPRRGEANDGQGGASDQGAPDRIGHKGKPGNPQTAQGTVYRMPRLANNPAQVRGQFNRAQAAARHDWAASRAAGGDGAWRGGDGKADRAVSKAERKADRAAARSAGNNRSDGGSRASSVGGRSSEGGSSGGGYRGSSGGSGSQGWSGGGSRGGGRGR